MGMTKLECPTCTAGMELSEDRDFYLCPYCGTKVAKVKQNIELSGTVRLDGVATADSLLERAFMFIEDGLFDDANQYLERVLDIQPKMAKAYIGKLLCALSLRSIEDLKCSKKYLFSYGLFDKALKYAYSVEKELYQSLSDAVSKQIENERRALQNEIDEIKTRISENETFLNQNKGLYNRYISKKIVWLMFMILSILFATFWLIGTIVIPMIAIISVPSTVIMILFIKKYQKVKKMTVNYHSRKNACKIDANILANKQAELDLWERTRR